MKISVITVCYNSAETIGHTLRSVREQTYGDIEHIIVDGGSTDDTLKVVATEGLHVAKLVSEKDDGIYDAMNKCLHLATGDVVAFLNSDDFYYDTEVLAKVARAFASPDVDACYGDLCYVKRYDTSTLVRYWRSSDFHPGAFERGWCPPHPTLFVRRGIYERFGMFDLSYRIAADVELMMRFLEVHQVRAKYLPEVLVKMRMGGTTNKSWVNIMEQNREVLRALKQHGLSANLIPFILHKLWSRGRQFITRPKNFSSSKS